MLESEANATTALNEPMAGPTLELSAKMAKFSVIDRLPHECSPSCHRHETKAVDNFDQVRKLHKPPRHLYAAWEQNQIRE